MIPRGLARRDVAHAGLPRLDVVESMHERKARTAELSDGFIALPGGWGTLEEWFEMLTWAQLGMHAKPCGLLNVAGYYDHLDAFHRHAMDQQFVLAEYRAMVMIEDRPERLLDRFAAYQAPQVTKWIGPAET